MWQLLLATLPTKPNAVRVRIWRALKSAGSPSLRDGAYVLPNEQASKFDLIEQDILANGGTAIRLPLHSLAKVQEEEMRARFDRTEYYAVWQTGLRKSLAALSSQDEAESRRQYRAHVNALQDIEAIDYYPSSICEQSRAMCAALLAAIDARFSPDEPSSQNSRPLLSLERESFQARLWVTRPRPWIDRLACAWLIARFIDRNPRFTWQDPQLALPSEAVGYDFDGAAFTHANGFISFEVMLQQFSLFGDARLARIANIAHCIDMGGNPGGAAVAEAAGLEALLLGLREQYADDAQLQAAANQVFDALYATPLTKPKEVL